MKRPPLCLWLSLAFACLGFTACTPDTRHVDPPSLGGVTTAIRTAGDLTTQARTIAGEIQRSGTPAQSVPSKQLVGLLDQTAEAHKLALASVDEKQAQINTLADQSNRLQSEVDRLRGQAEKRNLWIVLALIAGAVIYQGAAWAKNFHPYTALWPGFAVGAAAVLAAASVLWFLLSLWSGLGAFGRLFADTSPPRPPICFLIDPDDTGEGECPA